uniref:Uncharacterized protein n=1 Tax=Avena sativa TaxID=4498 RepID=A0ACD5UV66_AVESA
MAALQPCPSCMIAPAVCPNLRLSRWQQPRFILPLDRRNTGVLKIRPISHGIRAHSGAAGQPVNPDQEKFMASLTPEEKKIWDKVKEVATGAPDMPFREEVDILHEYRDKALDEVVHNKSILHADGAALACILCSRVRHATVLASKVVDCAALRLGLPDQISLHTTTQIMRTYVSAFVRTAEDIHHKRVTRETIISFLGALQGVASISHILVQDVLAYRTLIGSKDTSPDYVDDSEVDRSHLKYQVEMNNLKDELTALTRLMYTSL